MSNMNFQPHFLQVIFDPISNESPLQAEALEEIAKTNISNENELALTLLKYVKPYFDGFDPSLKEEVVKALEAANTNEFDIENEFDLDELLIEGISSNKEFFLRKMKEVMS